MLIVAVADACCNRAIFAHSSLGFFDWGGQYPIGVILRRGPQQDEGTQRHDYRPLRTRAFLCSQPFAPFLTFTRNLFRSSTEDVPTAIMNPFGICGDIEFSS